MWLTIDRKGSPARTKTLACMQLYTYIVQYRMVQARQFALEQFPGY
jgi:hypothetical protein